MFYGVVYKITCQETGKSYIGRTKQPLHKRWKDHCQVSSNCLYLKRAIEKYGEESFSIQAIASSWDKDALKELEALLIQQENTLVPNGYNLINNGAGFSEASQPTKEKLSKHWIGYWAKPESRERHSKFMKEKWNDPEYRENQSVVRTISANRPERKANWAAKVARGNKFNLGRKQPDTERKARSECMKQINLRKYGITFNGETLTSTDWAERLDMNQATLLWRIKRWGLAKALTIPVRQGRWRRTKKSSR